MMGHQFRVAVVLLVALLTPPSAARAGGWYLMLPQGVEPHGFRTSRPSP